MNHILNKYFDNIYALYISDFEFERIKYKLINNKIQAEYYFGMDGYNNLDLYNQFNQYFEKKNNDKKSTNYIKSPGAFGHIHSFIKIIQDAINKKYKKILILEPDIYFDKNFTHLVESYLTINYKILYLGASQHNWDNILQKKGYYYANNTCGTFAIGLDSSIFKEYLIKLKELINPSDVCLFDIQKKYNTHCIVVYPNLITCDVTKSTTTNRWRSQEELIKKFKWISSYINNERFMYLVNYDSIYKVVMEINYHDKKKKGWFVFKDDYDNITPLITLPNEILIERKNKILDGKTIMVDNYIFFIHAKLNKIYLYFENFHIDNVYFFEYSNLVNNTPESEQLIKSKITKYLNCKDKQISNYYSNFIKELKL